MANVGASSGAAVSALLQKASQQYLECRRKVSAKVDEVKTLESEIQTLFAHITTLGESQARAAKSIGRLELSVVAVEGEAPVEDAIVSVEIDPEYEEPVVEVTREEKAATEEATEEAANEETADKEQKKDDEGAEEETMKEDGEEAVEEEASLGEEAVEEEAKKEEEKPKAQRRSVQWSDAEGFPLSVVFDPVQSREAVVTISIAPAAKDGEETDSVKEFHIPVSSLFQTGSINRCYILKKVEHVHVDHAAITEVADEDEPKAEEAEKEETETPAEAEKEAEETEKAADAETRTEEEKAADAETPAEKQEDEKKVVAPATEEAEEKKTEEGEPKVEEVPIAPHQTLVETTATVESEDKVVVLKEGKLHVQVHFTMSEIEKLSQTAIALSQQKQEAEAVLAVLEREAASLRTKYERLNASQRSLSASGGVVKPRSTLLGGRGLGAAQVRVEKSTYQKVKDSVSAVLTPQRTQVLTSLTIFCGSVAMFHFLGDNLLA